MSAIVKLAGESFLDALGGCVRLRGDNTVIIEAAITRQQFDNAIKSVIRAMRQPSQAMVEACGADDYYDSFERRRDNWETMIDEALK